jgi:DNA invertase Pin-like site-specific DNA recombinase
MNERAKITASHLARQAIVYLRQSSPAQVEHNRESTQRQYALANRAREFGWSDEQIVVIDRSPLTATSAIMRAIMRANSSSAAMRAA